MAMQYDVKAVTLTSDDTAVSYRTRVKGLLISPTPGSAGSVVVKDGGTGGTTRLSISVASGATSPFPVVIPGEGILYSTDVYVDVTTVAAVTVFYG